MSVADTNTLSREIASVGDAGTPGWQVRTAPFRERVTAGLRLREMAYRPSAHLFMPTDH